MNDRHDTTASALPTTRSTLADAIAHAKECFAAFDAAAPGVEALEHAWFADRENAHKAAARQDGLNRLGVMSQASEDAIHAVIAAPILSLADMQAKAQYLVSVKGFYFDEPAFNALLANMAGDAQSSAGAGPTSAIKWQHRFNEHDGALRHAQTLADLAYSLMVESIQREDPTGPFEILEADAKGVVALLRAIDEAVTVARGAEGRL